MGNIFDFITLTALLVVMLIQKGISVCTDAISPSAVITLEGTTSCYYAMNGAYPYPAAKALCESGGTHLLFLETKDEQLEIKVTFPQFNYNWLGIEKKGGVWKWVDGTECRDADTSKFVVDSDDEEFAKTVELWTSDLWDDVTSTLALSVICEREFVTNPNATSCNLTTPSSTVTATSTPATDPSTTEPSTTQITSSVTSATASNKHGTTEQLFRKRSVSKTTRVLISHSESSSKIDCATKCLASTNCIGFKYYMTGLFCESLADAVPTGTVDACGSSSQFVCYEKI